MESRILNHLQLVGNITSWEAIKEYGCTRLSHYIWVLRNKGYPINDRWKNSINRFGDKVHFKEYVYGGTDE